MSVIDSIVAHLDGFRWENDPPGNTPQGEKKAAVADMRQDDVSTASIADGKENARAAMHTTDLAGIQSLIADSALPREEKASLSDFVQRSASLIVTEDWDEYVARMRQLVALKAALHNEQRLTDVLADALDSEAGWADAAEP